MSTLTAANSVIYLTIPDLFPVPQQLQGFAAEDVFSTEAVTPVTTLMGVDGVLSGGWSPTEKKMMIHLQADSASVLFFDAWQQSQEALLDTLTAEGLVTLPSIGRIFTCTRGFLTTFPPTTDARKILQPRAFGITWQSIFSAPV